MVVDGYVESGHLRSRNNVREVRGRCELSGKELEARGTTMLNGVAGGRRRTWWSPAAKFSGLAAGWCACVGGSREGVLGFKGRDLRTVARRVVAGRARGARGGRALRVVREQAVGDEGGRSRLGCCWAASAQWRPNLFFVSTSFPVFCFKTLGSKVFRKILKKMF